MAQLQIMRRLSDGQEVHIVDKKNELGPIFKKHAKIWNASETEEAIAFLREKIEERTILFANTMEEFGYPIEGIDDYVEMTGNSLPIITLVIEEWLALIDENVNINVLNSLLMLGRSSGVYVMVLAQYINDKIMKRKTSINFTTVVFLGKFDRIAANILFGTLEKEFVTEAQRFMGPPGKALIYANNAMNMVVVPKINRELLAEWM